MCYIVTLNVKVTMGVLVKTTSVCTYICQFAAVLTNFMAHFFFKLVRHSDKRKLMSLQFYVSYIYNRKVRHDMLEMVDARWKIMYGYITFQIIIVWNAEMNRISNIHEAAFDRIIRVCINNSPRLFQNEYRHYKFADTRFVSIDRLMVFLSKRKATWSSIHNGPFTEKNRWTRMSCMVEFQYHYVQ